MMDIIDKIDKLRVDRGWSVYSLSEFSGVSQSSIATMYQRNTPPKIETLKALCDAFGLTLAQFFLEDEQTEILTAEEKELIIKFRTLSQDQKTALLKLL